MEGVIRGYRPQVDWGGEGGSATIMVGRHNVQVATAGWRKRCLFVLLAALLLLSLVNLLLTIWILRKINFNAEGAGDLHIKVGGVELEGIARIDHEMSVSKIEAKPSSPLDIIGYYNVSAGTVLEDGSISSLLLLDPKGLIGISKTFSIKDTRGNLIFKAERGKTEVGSTFYSVKGDDGAYLSDSLQTPRVLGDEVHEFRLESQTRSLKGSAANLVRLEARDGDVSTTALKGVILESKKGKIRFESPNVFFTGLPEFSEEENELQSTTKLSKSKNFATKVPEVPWETQIEDSLLEFQTPKPTLEHKKSREESLPPYNVCVCPSGKLFLSANPYCHHDDSICS